MQVARFLSVVFHPLLMTTYLFLILMLQLPAALAPLHASWWFVILIFGLTFFLPSLNFLFFRSTGTITNFQMFERSERVLPFAFISILYGVVTFMFYWKFPVPGVLKFMMIITALVLVCAIVTIFYKLSIHSAGVWGVIGILLPLNKASETGSLLWPTVIAILVAGLVMSARLKQNAHVPREILVGAVTGFLVGFAGVIYFF